MSNPLRISEARFTPAPAADSADGLLGFITLVLNGALRLDGLTLRVTKENRRILAWPARLDSRGASHSIVRPISNDVRREIELQVFDALGIGEGSP